MLFEFKANPLRIILYFTALNVFLSVLIFIVGDVTLNPIILFILFGIVNLYYLTTVILQPIKIILYQDKFTVEVCYFFPFLRKSKIVSLGDLECTFGFEIRARGMKTKVFKIVQGNRVIVELLTDYNGWSSEILTTVCDTLNRIKNVPPDSLTGAECVTKE